MPKEIEDIVLKDLEERKPKLPAGWPKMGMLVVDQTIPEGVADGKLIPGDILYKLNGKIVNDFVTYEEILDGNVGGGSSKGDLVVEFFRGNSGADLTSMSSPKHGSTNKKTVVSPSQSPTKKPKNSTANINLSQCEVHGGSSSSSSTTRKEKIRVKSFSEFTPDRFLEAGGGIFHAIPYNYARMLNLPTNKGVWAASRGFLLGSKIGTYSIIYKINDKEINSLVDFVKALRKIRNGERFSVTWQKQSSGESRVQKTSGILMERNIISGEISTWILEKKEKGPKQPDSWRKLTKQEAEKIYGPVPDPKALEERKITPKGFSTLKNFWTAQKSQIPSYAKAIAPYLVVAEFRSPLGTEVPLSHTPVQTKEGCGLIIEVNKEEVTIVIDRTSVPQLVGLIQVEFGKILRVPGRVKFVHPFHNITLIAVERWRLGDFPLPTKPLPYTRKMHAPGEELRFVGLSCKNKDLTFQEVSVISYFCPNYKLTHPPMWRERNIIGLTLEEQLYQILGGVVVDGKDRLIGLYLPFASQIDEEITDMEHDYGILPFYQYVAPLFPKRYVEIENERSEETSSEEDSANMDDSNDSEESSSVSEADVEKAREVLKSLTGPGGNSSTDSEDNDDDDDVDPEMLAMAVQMVVSSKKRSRSEALKGKELNANGGNPKKKQKLDNHTNKPKSKPTINPSLFPDHLSHIPTLSLEFKPISLSDAEFHGVPTSWVTKLMNASTTNMQCLCVERLTQGGCGRMYGLQEGDVLLAVNDRVVVTPLDVEDELRKWQYEGLALTGNFSSTNYNSCNMNNMNSKSSTSTSENLVACPNWTRNKSGSPKKNSPRKSSSPTKKPMANSSLDTNTNTNYNNT